MNVRENGVIFLLEELFAFDWRVLVGAVHTRDGAVTVWMCKERQ